MTRFVAIHQLPQVATQDEVCAAGQALTAQSFEGARWLGGWFIPEYDHLICEWEAVSEEAVRAALEGAHLFPTEAIYAAHRFDSAWFAGGESDSANKQT